MDQNDQLRHEIEIGLQRIGIDASSLSKRIGRSKDYVREFLSGRKRSIAQDAASQIRAILRDDPVVSPASVALASEQPAPLASGYRPPPEFLGDRDFKVFASAECGPGEIQVFSTDPYDLIPRPWNTERDPDAFGVLLTGDSMEPLYEAGQIAIVSPKAPLVKGKQALFLAEPMGGDFRASVKRYRGQTVDRWLVKQLNPEKEFEFEREEWGTAYRVLGALDG